MFTSNSVLYECFLLTYLHQPANVPIKYQHLTCQSFRDTARTSFSSPPSHLPKHLSAYLDAMGENKTRKALKACQVKTNLLARKQHQSKSLSIFYNLRKCNNMKYLQCTNKLSVIRYGVDLYAFILQYYLRYIMQVHYLKYIDVIVT